MAPKEEPARQTEEPWDEVFKGLPDLIASGRSGYATVLFKMSRNHAGILGAYLNARNDIAPLPVPLKEILDALTLRLVGPSAGQWNELRRILDGQPVIRPKTREEWFAATQQGRRQQELNYEDRVPRDDNHKPHTPRHRRPYDGGPDGEDLNRNVVPLLGDADGTTMDEWPSNS